MKKQVNKTVTDAVVENVTVYRQRIGRVQHQAHTALDLLVDARREIERTNAFARERHVEIDTDAAVGNRIRQLDDGLAYLGVARDDVDARLECGLIGDRVALESELLALLEHLELGAHDLLV